MPSILAAYRPLAPDRAAHQLLDEQNGYRTCEEKLEVVGALQQSQVFFAKIQGRAEQWLADHPASYPPRMTKFEYDIFTCAWGHGSSTEPIKAELNRRGEEGWELVATTRDESPEDDHDDEVVMFVFKRAKS